MSTIPIHVWNTMLNAQEKAHGKGHTVTTFAKQMVARCTADNAQRNKLLTDCVINELTLVEADKSTSAERTMEVTTHLINCFIECNRFGEAQTMIQAVLPYDNKKFGTQSVITCSKQFQLAEACIEIGDYSTAADALNAIPEPLVTSSKYTALKTKLADRVAYKEAKADMAVRECATKFGYDDSITLNTRYLEKVRTNTDALPLYTVQRNNLGPLHQATLETLFLLLNQKMQSNPKEVVELLAKYYTDDPAAAQNIRATEFLTKVRLMLYGDPECVQCLSDLNEKTMQHSAQPDLPTRLRNVVRCEVGSC